MFKHLAINPEISLGRLYVENDFDLRTPFERDRARVIHSNSFRKLKYKTQVFIESESDYYRTRLTHSLEVAQISRSICRMLNLNEDLGETVALAHDLGHPPFGHSGEDALNETMNNFGGFNHNDQTLRVLTSIEKRHPYFDGLNLTWESLEGIVKHNGTINQKLPYHLKNYIKKQDLKLNLQPFLESQIASISDDIAYNNHDVEDAVRANLINLDELSEIYFFKDIIDELQDQYKNISDKQLLYQVLRNSMSSMINDIYKTTSKNLNNFNSINDIQNYDNFVVSYSDNMKKNCKIIKEFLSLNVYNHKNLLDKRNYSKNVVHKLFHYFIANNEKLPNDWTIQNIEIERLICDYISGMTDRFALNLFKEIYE
ncbi:MAG: deoxyguanosinetriphosphate triphosphohydrolase [Pelagibacteraceae bacterium TMED237]|nr:MAG: deoxyguanosinetriphosphate triphosphohydrolase [Pelagibacteraceae bacterium TMED237]|tara:strand:- start:3871 stop:4983 length:1113 start_codon:yes stop_codon:yes gene_type:complete